jgi:hypothetical protein
MQPNEPGRIGWLRNQWTHTAFGVLIGVLVSLAIYLAQKKEREVVYVVNPTRTQIVSAGQTSAIRVLYQGKELTSDVTSVQIAIWNRGRLPTRRQNVERPATIQLIPSVPILESRLINERRPDISIISLDKTNEARGQLRVDWNILEHDDGGVIQIVFPGTKGHDIRITGTIEEEGDIQPASSRKLVSMALLALGMIVAPLGANIVLSRLRGMGYGWALILSLVFISVMAGFVFAAQYWITKPLTPFGF